MKKEIVIEDTEYEYYCDLCGEKQKGYSSMGSPTYPSEMLKKCGVCGQEICSQCRTTLPESYYWDCSASTICSACATEKADEILELYTLLLNSLNSARKLNASIFNREYREIK